MFVFKLCCLSLIHLCLAYSCFMLMASAQVTAAFVAGNCDISMLPLRISFSHLLSMLAPLSSTAPLSHLLWCLSAILDWIEHNIPKPVTNYLFYIFAHLIALSSCSLCPISKASLPNSDLLSFFACSTIACWLSARGSSRDVGDKLRFRWGAPLPCRLYWLDCLPSVCLPGNCDRCMLIRVQWSHLRHSALQGKDASGISLQYKWSGQVISP